MNRIIRLLEAGQPILGIFSGEKTAAQGALMIQNKEVDFVFYSLERGPFDIPTMQVYVQAMLDGAGEEETHPIALRIPPIRQGHELARDRTHQGLNAGADAIVFPHVQTPEEAAWAVSSMGPRLWPVDSEGDHVNMIIIEDRRGVENVREIVATTGVAIAICGPGDLRRAYEGDMEAVEEAIQTILSACKELDVACGITAGVDDIAERLAQGFRVIIVDEPEALTVGRRAAGRVP